MVCQLHFDIIRSRKLHGHRMPCYLFETLDKAGAFFPNYQDERRYSSEVLKRLKNWPKDGEKIIKSEKIAT